MTERPNPCYITNMDKLKSTPKDVFTHLLSIVALYISAINFIVLLFQYINLSFPDPLEGFYYGGVAGTIRWAMASLIIVYPVYILVTRFLNQEYREEPEKRELKIRKWLVYFTLFVASVTIIGDLVTLVYNFLGGELTARFLLKVVVVLLVSGIVFLYYLKDLRGTWKKGQLKILVWVVSAIILSGLVGGFFTAGSPFKARLVRFDEARVSHLQIIQSEIINYWMRKDKLPNDLDELQSDITGFRPPVDPKTNLAYEYRVVSDLKFELCANFDLSSNPVPAISRAKTPYPIYGPYDQNWDHEAGPKCFERNIDPELYPKDTRQKPF